MTVSLYIHWPYCASKCPYCDFNSHVRGTHGADVWADCILAEAALTKARTSYTALKSIFFGGGTPSLIPPPVLKRVLEGVAACWNITKDTEITLEANPGSVDEDNFKGYGEAGVNRLSLGIQSLRADDLAFLGRKHSVEEAKRAIRLAASCFERFSFDLIYARPNQSVEAWSEELEEAFSYNPKHLSLYQLTIEPGTAFHTKYVRGELIIPTDILSSDLYEVTGEITTAHGL